jgi:hypothetical protein
MGRAGWLRVAAAAGCAALTCAFATALVASRVAAWRRWRRALAVVRDFEESFATPAERLQRVVNSLAIEMFAGLASEDASKVRMLLTCVDSLPDGYNTDADLPIPLLFLFHASLLNFTISNQFAQCGHANLLLFANFLAFLDSNGASLILLLLFFYLSGLFWVYLYMLYPRNKHMLYSGSFSEVGWCLMLISTVLVSVRRDREREIMC